MLNYDKLSRSNEEANSLSKEDVIEIEGIVRISDGMWCTD